MSIEYNFSEIRVYSKFFFFVIRISFTIKQKNKEIIL